MNDAEAYELFDADPAPIVAFLSWLMSGVRGPGPLDVLDVGCGPGRLLEPLSALGHRVVGLEPDPAYRARAERRVPGVEVRSGGFNEISDQEKFDLLVGINGSFAYLLDPEQREDAIARCHRALRPGGIFFVDLPNFLWILKEYRPPQEARVHGLRLTRKHQLDYSRAIFRTIEEYSGADFEVPLIRRHDYAITTLPELGYFLRRAGFRELSTFTHYRARSSEPLDSGRMMIAARRPAAGIAEMIARLVMWARGRSEVRAVAIVGSRARNSARADSDLDVIVLAREPRLFLEDESWIGELGATSIARRQNWGAVDERRLIVEGLGGDAPHALHVELNFGVPSWASIEPLDSGTRRVIEDGFRVLHDPDALLAGLERILRPARGET